jgi:tRNA-splicing ligase RtcB
VITHVIRQVFQEMFSGADEISVVYDVSHNIAKFEEYHGEQLCVHRKGATRAFPPGSMEIPQAYGAVGQPVFVPGSMGTASYILAGQQGSLQESFGSVCHGAGRAMSRGQARRSVRIEDLRKQLDAQGIVVIGETHEGLVEEAPKAYKDVDRVVEIVETAGLCNRVARVVPIGVMKG